MRKNTSETVPWMCPVFSEKIPTRARSKPDTVKGTVHANTRRLLDSLESSTANDTERAPARTRPALYTYPTCPLETVFPRSLSALLYRLNQGESAIETRMNG